MKVLAFSDLHRDVAAAKRLVAEGAKADLVIGAGDFATVHRGLDEIMQALAPLDNKLVVVPGNGETADALRAATSATVLHGDSLHRDGIEIVGLGAAVPPLHGNTWGSFDLSESRAAEMLAGYRSADILVSHSPAYGHCDQLADGRKVGSTAVMDAVIRLQPRVLLCGHIHDCWGGRSQIGRTEVYNLGPEGVWLEV